MCGICGCGGTEARIGTAAVGSSQGGGQEHRHEHGHEHDHAHDVGHDHDHDHGHGHGHHHDHQHPHDHDHDHDARAARPPDRPHGGDTASRVIQVERDLLEANDRLAAVNRELFAAAGVLALNLVSSPGAGKTTLLVRSLQALKQRWPLAVIEGDQETDNDAARVRATGVPAVQVNTGKGCHLDARMVFRSFESLPLPRGGVLFIENVGNLVCPAAFDLGEAHKVVVLSTTEGEDKPAKYPDMFAAADLMLLNKADLLPHLDFDVGACLAAALRVNPRLQTLVVSARTGEGLAAFYAWIEARAARAARQAG